MKRLVFYFSLAAVIAAGYAMYSKNDMGLMQVSFAEYNYQATLFEVGVVALAALFIYLLLSYLIGVLKTFSENFGEKRNQQLVEKAHHALDQGVIELTEGRFDRAEKVLLQKVEHNEHALISYLAAALAAQCQGAYDRRDDYLRRAHNSSPDADLAIGLTQARLQMDHDQHHQALTTLRQLTGLAPQHAGVLKLTAAALCKLGEWDSLRELLPIMQRTDAISADKLLSVENEMWCGLISERAKSGNIDTLTQLWNEIPRDMKTLADVVECYVRELIRLQASGEAERVLREFLDTNWTESTVTLYSELDVLASAQQINTAEGWLHDHQHNEYLLLALGKMCISNSDWGKARNYLEASLTVAPMPTTYLKLAQLLEEHMDDRQLAQEYYRQGLHMLSGDYGEQALANAEKDFERVIMKPELRVI